MQNDKIKKEFIKAVNYLIENHSHSDFELMETIENYTFDFLTLIDGHWVEIPSIKNDLIQGELHHEFIRSRLFRNPKRNIEIREKFLDFLKHTQEEIYASHQ